MPENDVLKCPQCHKLFTPYKWGQRFCSPECRKVWHNERTKTLMAIGKKHLDTAPEDT